ncbi:MAG: hypothetical protein U0531_00165 [Dehalococcoidia bacterium]
MAVLAFSFVASFALAKVVNAVVGLRATEEQEVQRPRHPRCTRSGLTSSNPSGVRLT